jgi:hypothetical protein
MTSVKDVVGAWTDYPPPFIPRFTMQIPILVHNHTTADAIYPFDARGIAKAR